MLEFKQTDTSAEVVVTLTELVTITNPYYLFVFTHVTTKNKVKFIKGVDDDESNTPSRYNLFTIDPSALFAGMPVGEWHYTIYEQESNSNIDVSQTGAALEHGKLMLRRDPSFEFTKYNETTTYKAYNG